MARPPPARRTFEAVYEFIWQDVMMIPMPDQSRSVRSQVVTRSSPQLGTSMRPSFEELVGQDLDRLYRAGFFLSGGVPDGAERLVTIAVLGGFREYRTLEGAPTRPDLWFDGHLARAFLGEHGTGAAFSPRPSRRWKASGGALSAESEGPGRGGDRLSDLGFEGLAGAGATLLPPQRVAFWLVALERRRYRDVGEILDAPRESVAQWVREAHRALHKALGAQRPGQHRKGGA